MTVIFQDVYGVLELVAAQLQDHVSLEEEEQCHILNLPKTAKLSVKNQATITAPGLEK